MLLESETAVKAAHDIIHNAEEFFDKWLLLLASQEEVPEGYVDFEFADGSLLRVPCAWQTLLFAEGAERPYITFKRGDTVTTWRPGTVSSFMGGFEGLVSDGPVALNVLFVESILALTGTYGTGYVNIEDAEFDTITTFSVIAAYCVITNLVINTTAQITGGTFENLGMLGAGTLDADLDELTGDSLIAEDMSCTGEQVVPVEKVNAWYSDYGPKTDADVTGGGIPLLPLSASAQPINGFDKPLESNPFFPDWFYVSNYGATWKAGTVWVPSRTKPSKPAWQDTDGIYWYQANVSTTASMFGSPNMIFPPRCHGEGSYVDTVAPVTAEADGLVVTVKIVEKCSVPICLTDRYTFQDENTWTWFPGNTIIVKGPCIEQFVVKRVFYETAGKITAVEYQFLPLGDMDVGY